MVLSQIIKLYGPKVRIVFRDYPLSGHPVAFLAAQAADCAQDQGKYWEYHDLLFANQKDLTQAKLKEHAAQLKLDEKAFGECLDSGKYAPEVEKDKRDGMALGINSTPVFFVNGKKLRGERTLANFKQLIDQELKRFSKAKADKREP